MRPDRPGSRGESRMFAGQSSELAAISATAKTAKADRRRANWSDRLYSRTVAVTSINPQSTNAAKYVICPARKGPTGTATELW